MGITVLGLVLAALLWGWEGLAVVAILSVLEISLSFDNAVVNAGVLKKMNAFWQKIFLTVGVLIAVFGMRLVFPIIIVAISAKIGPVDAVRVALEHPDRYEQLVTDAHPAIAAFGGMFLLMIFLDFIFEDRDIKWLNWLEKPLAKLGKVDMLSVCIALIGLLITATTLATAAHQHGGIHADKSGTVLTAGVAGLITYLIVNGLSGHFENRLEEQAEEEEEAEEAARAQGKQVSAVGLAGKAAFFMFLYLEVLDASFSFDGVIGAFAITPDPIIIMLGLGVGALFVRSMTIYLVRQGTLAEYVYLENGAHWAIGALAIMLLLTMKFHLGEAVIGGIGIALILAAWGSSIVAKRRREAGTDGDEPPSDHETSNTTASASNAGTTENGVTR